MSDLDGRLLAAHAANDRAALVDLYRQAAQQAKEVDAACFFLTHAYVFALELGHPAADGLHARLAARGRV